MKIWLAIRIFIAFFLALFGLHFVFGPADNSPLLLGAAVSSIGLTFLCVMWLEVRRIQP